MKRLNTILNVKAKELEKKGVFNAFIDLDSKLHVDPSLLVGLKIPEFKDSYAKFSKYFKDLIKIITHSKVNNDAFWKKALTMLAFKENSSFSLGYSQNSASGSGIGKQLAGNLLATSKSIIDAGIKDPEIFELIGLLEEGIGADRISDMTLAILDEDFRNFTRRVCGDLKIQTKKKDGYLPVNPKTKKAIVFVPSKLLRDLPIAYSWSDIDLVCKYNESLRAKMNNLVGSTWKEVIKHMKKNQIREMVLAEPQVFKDLIQQYREKERKPYDFSSDPAGEIVWSTFAEMANEFPLDLSKYETKKLDCSSLLSLVELICQQFKKLIEDNGWNEFLYLKGKLRNERFPQKLFYGVADIYCTANHLDVSRESNAGIGALDFKVSQGKTRVSVEIKYSKNQNLVNGFEVQLPAYIKSENACAGIYLVIQVPGREERLRNLQNRKGSNLPKLIVADGRIKPSASKRK